MNRNRDETRHQHEKRNGNMRRRKNKERAHLNKSVVHWQQSANFWKAGYSSKYSDFEGYAGTFLKKNRLYQGSEGKKRKGEEITTRGREREEQRHAVIARGGKEKWAGGKAPRGFFLYPCSLATLLLSRHPAPLSCFLALVPLPLLLC